MKDNQVSKLYKLLAPHEQAALAFGHMTNLDETAVEQVLEAVPKRIYTSLDADYEHHIDRIFCMALMWGIQYWKLQARLLSAFNRARQTSDDMPFGERMAAYEAVEGHLLAHDAALASVCEQFGLDHEAVRRMSEAEPLEKRAQCAVADPTYLTQCKDELTQCLTAVRKLQ